MRGLLYNTQTLHNCLIIILTTLHTTTTLTTTTTTGGRTLKLKEIVDAAVVQTSIVNTVFVFKRTGSVVPMKEGR